MPIEKIKQILGDPSSLDKDVGDKINQQDHFEVARRLHELSKDEKIRVFNFLDTDQKRQEVLYETDQDSRLEIQGTLNREYLARLIDTMAEDEAADILQEHDQEIQEDILSKMGPHDAGIIKNLIEYDDETAGGLMIPEFNRINMNWTAADILMNLKKETNHDSMSYFYVVNERQELMGFFKLRDLLNVPPNLKASQFIRPNTPKVFLDDNCEKVANLMDNEHLSNIPVVDPNNKIHGIVTFDDVIRKTMEIASEDIFTMVGTAKVDPFAKRTAKKIAARAPWLLTTFIGGLASAMILSYYEGTLAEFATIIFFVPFVLGLSGNIGIQGATVIVRGLATGDIQSDNIMTVIKSELLVGFANGVIFGTLCGGVVALLAKPLLGSEPILGLVVGSGIICAVAVAALIGSLCPFLFLKLDIDPAISTGPFVTVTNDFIGIGIYLFTAAMYYSIL